MNVVLYTRCRASELTIGTVMLDLPDEDPDNPDGEGTDRLPGAYTVAELRTTLDGLEVYARPVSRTAGKRSVWRLAPDELVDVELSRLGAARALEALSKAAAASGLNDLCVARGPGGPSIPAPREAPADD